MSLEDPFFVVQEENREVNKALNKTCNLYGRWLELHNANNLNPVRDELDWASTELRNALRSIEWDLEDLEDTISIIEKNPSKFKIDNKELSNRRNFIEDAREEVKSMKDKMNFSRNQDKDKTARQPLLENLASPPRIMSHGPTKYSKLENEIDSPNRQFLNNTILQQSRMLAEQDEQLEIIGDSMATLKTVSRQIGNELDEQAVMLDDFGYELESVDSKLNSTMVKMAKALKLSNDRRQWMAIGVLIVILIVIIVLYIVL